MLWSDLRIGKTVFEELNQVVGWLLFEFSSGVGGASRVAGRQRAQSLSDMKSVMLMFAGYNVVS